MSACTKFKIASMLLFSGPRIQRFSTGNAADGNTTNRGPNEEPIENATVKFDSHECSKDELKMNSFVSAANAKYMEYLFSKWVKNKNSVHKSWHLYFNDILQTQKSSSDKTTAKKSSKLKVEPKSYVNLFAKVDKIQPLKTVEKLKRKKSESESGSKSSNVTSDEINNQPPSQTDQACVVGQIILSPISEDTTNLRKSDKSKDIQDFIEKKLKSEQSLTMKNNESNFNKDDPEFKKRIEHIENMQNKKRLNKALERTPFNKQREHIKAQLKLIEKNKLEKSMERKQKREENSGSGISVKSTKPKETTQK